MPVLPCRIAVVGPTASGKTALALSLAQHLATDVIGVDSVQVYCGFDIGSAKPTQAQRAGIQHHLIDIVQHHQIYSAGQFAKDAQRVIQEVEAQGKTVLLCGGAGLYLRTALQGIASFPPIPPALRQRVQTMLQIQGLAAGYTLLSQVDRFAAKTIHPHDSQRIGRALEVYYASSRPLSAWHTAYSSHTDASPPQAIASKSLKSWLFVGFAWPRNELRQRIAQRTQAMLQAGWLEETQTLLAQGCSPNAQAMGSIGYKQVLAYLETPFAQRPSLERLGQEIALRTGQFAKRQLTWLRNQGFGNPEQPSALPIKQANGAWVWWFEPQQQALVLPKLIQRFPYFAWPSPNKRMAGTKEML